MTFEFRHYGIAAVSMAMLLGATALSPAMADSGRDKVLATIAEAAKAAGGAEVEWGDATGSDTEFTVDESTVTVTEGEKETTFTAAKTTFVGAKPTADGGWSADKVVATDVEVEADDGGATIASIEVTGYVGQSPEKIRAKTTTGEQFASITAKTIVITDEKDKSVPIASIAFTASDWVAGVPRKGGFEVKGIEVPVDAADPNMKDAAELGYTKFSIDAAFAGSWDDKTGRLTVDKLSVSGADAGAIKLAFTVGGLTPQVLDDLKKAEATKDQGKQMELLQGLTIEKLSLRYEDASLAKRVISAQAKKQGMGEDALVSQLQAMVPMLVSAIGNKDFEQKIVSAAGAFLKAPKSLTVSAAPAKPMPVSELMGAAMMAPQSLPTVLGADVKAND